MLTTGGEVAELLSWRREAFHIQQSIAPRFRVHDGDLLAEILQPDLILTFDDDVFARDAIQQMLPKTGAHRAIVGREADGNIVVAQVTRLRVSGVVNIERALTVGVRMSIVWRRLYSRHDFISMLSIVFNHNFN